MANLVLPLDHLLGRDGVCCSSGRQYVARPKLIGPPGGKADRDMICALAQRLGAEHELAMTRCWSASAWATDAFAEFEEALDELPAQRQPRARLDDEPKDPLQTKLGAALPFRSPLAGGPRSPRSALPENRGR